MTTQTTTERKINSAYDQDTLFNEFAASRVKDAEGNVISFDVAKRNALVQANMKLVPFVVDKFYGRVPELKLVRQDVIQEGSIGLMEALPRFEPGLGYRFSTYGTYWIRQAISNYLLENKSSLTTPVHVRLAYNKLLKEAKQNQISLKELVDICKNNGREDLKITQKMGKNIQASLETKYVMSLSQPISTDGSQTIGDTIEDLKTDPEGEMDKKKLIAAAKTALLSLNKRQQLILLLRYNIISNVEENKQ